MSNSAVEVFDFRFSPAYQAVGLPFGITPATTGVELTDTTLAVRFGPWRLRTGLDNIDDLTVTGPFKLWKAAGPARLSLADRGLTYATNGESGLCIHFKRPVSGLEPLGLLRHPGVTVTVTDPRVLASSLNARMHAR
jgi:hypothetical protein